MSFPRKRESSVNSEFINSWILNQVENDRHMDATRQ